MGKAATAKASNAKPRRRKPALTEERAQIQVIARAADILRALENEERGLSLAEIAARVELPRSTVQRIVAALESEKFLIAVSAAGRVRLGPALLRLAASVNIGVTAIARPLIAELSSALKETVDISTPRKDHLVFIDQVVGSQRLRTVSAVGEAFALHCTANGKAYLAQMSDAEVIRLIGRKYEARTPKTLTTFDQLQPELVRIRHRGYAVDHEEHALGISAAGVALIDTLGNALMVSVPVPTARFVGRQEIIIEKLLETQKKLQERFGSEL